MEVCESSIFSKSVLFQGGMANTHVWVLLLFYQSLGQGWGFNLRDCLFLGLMNTWLGIISLDLRQYFQAIDFCFTWQTAFQLRNNIHHAKLFAMLSQLVNLTEIFPPHKWIVRTCKRSGSLSLKFHTGTGNFVHGIVNKPLLQMQVFSDQWLSYISINMAFAHIWHEGALFHDGIDYHGGYLPKYYCS